MHASVSPSRTKRTSAVASPRVWSAAVAHELSQPLTGVLSNTNACLRMLSADQPDLSAVRETARLALRDASRAGAMLKCLRALVLAREHRTGPVDLNAEVVEVLAMLRSELDGAGVATRCELDENLPPVPGDRLQLQQVILNLARNAIDAMAGTPEGERELIVSTRPENGGTSLVVCDTGVGMDRHDCRRPVKAFRTTKAQGMGIGLCICHSIVEAHGGRLRATPNDGPGTTFRVWIPRGPRPVRS